jgi:hypothetical protein
MVVAEKIERITPEILSWQAFEPAVKCDLSSAAIVTPQGLVFVDPIALARPALSALAGEFPPVAIILTNGNHGRDAERYRDAFGIPVCAHGEAAGALEIRPDRILVEGEPAPGGLDVLAIRGAGPGEIALLRPGLACFGDAVVNLPPGGLRLLPEKYCSDPAALPGSLRKLLYYDFDVMTFAHGAPLAGMARQSLELLLS